MSLDKKKLNRHAARKSILRCLSFLTISLKMSTFRLFSSSASAAASNRLSTAVPLKSGKFLQVYPERREFDSQQDWITSWSSSGTISVVETPASVPKPRKFKPSRTITDRLVREMMEFVDPAFLTNVTSAAIIAPDTVIVTAHDSASYSIHRSKNYFDPPVIIQDGERVTTYDSQWSPALTSSKWFLMTTCAP